MGFDNGTTERRGNWDNGRTVEQVILRRSRSLSSVGSRSPDNSSAGLAVFGQKGLRGNDGASPSRSSTCVSAWRSRPQTASNEREASLQSSPVASNQRYNNVNFGAFHGISGGHGRRRPSTGTGIPMGTSLSRADVKPEKRATTNLKSPPSLCNGAVPVAASGTVRTSSATRSQSATRRPFSMGTNRGSSGSSGRSLQQALRK